MASLFRNIVWLKFTKLLEARNASVFVCMGRCFGKIRNITRVASVFSTESVNYRKRESNYRKHHIKFPYMYSVFGSVSLVAVNLNDKEGGNSPSSLTSQSHSPSPFNHVKRSANGRYTKPGEKGTPKNLEHVRRRYQIKTTLRKGNWSLETVLTKTNHPLNEKQGVPGYGRFGILYSLHRGAITETINFFVL